MLSGIFGSKASPEQDLLNRSLLLAASVGNVTRIEQVLADGAKVDARDDVVQNTPLHLAASSGHNDAVKSLLAAGARINARNERHATPLHYAARYGDEDTVKLLIAAGATLGSKNKQKQTPIDAARAEGHPVLVDYMQSVANGAIPRPTLEGVWWDIAKRDAARAALEKDKEPVSGPQTAEQTRDDRQWREAEEIREKLRKGITDPSEVGF